MSTATRIFSGSIASWAHIGVAMIAQIVLVPVYLSHWSLLTYGTWLAVQSIVGLVSTIDFGHQEFLSYEFLKIGVLKREQLSRYLWSGVLIGILISFIQILIVFVIIKANLISKILDKSTFQLVHQAGVLLILQMIAWLVSTSTIGLLFRVLAPFGYFPRMVWWNLLGSIITTVVPLFAVILGTDLLVTGIVMIISGIIISIPIYFDLFRIIRRENIVFVYPDIDLGFKNFLRSLAISSKEILENTRQQGTRLVLAPLAGATGLAAFSTMRTGSNVALQGLRTIINPLMPELMRFLHQRDQHRSETAFSTVWLVLVALMAPGVVLLQAVVEPFYTIWTRGQIAFNPLLFSALSTSVLIYAVAQPAMAVVRGNNLLKVQVSLSALAATIVIGGIIISVPLFGIAGSGFSLLLAELVSTLGYKIFAQRWLVENGLKWPNKLFNIAIISILIAVISMIIMILFPQVKWYTLIISFLFFLINIYSYWQSMPLSATKQVSKIVTYFNNLSILSIRNQKL